MPKVYIVTDSAPNAFATGRDKDHAVVCVTTGLLSILEKSELEGVIAHELSHVGNRDMLLSTVVVVLVGFISILADVFRRNLFFGNLGRRSNDDNGNNAVFMIVGIVTNLTWPMNLKISCMGLLLPMIWSESSIYSERAGMATALFINLLVSNPLATSSEISSSSKGFRT